MSASMVPVTENTSKTIRRRPVGMGDEKKNLVLANERIVSPNVDSDAGGSGGVYEKLACETSKDLCYLIKEEAVFERSKEMAALAKKSQLPNSTVSPRRNRKDGPPNIEKPWWQTVLSVFTKNLLLLLVLLGLFQMVRKLVIDSRLDGSNSLTGFTDMEGRIAGVDSSLKTVSKMLQVQLEAVERKLESEIWNLRREVNRKIEDRCVETDAALGKLGERAKILDNALTALRSKHLLTKDDFVRLYGALKKENIGDLSQRVLSLDEIIGFAREIVKEEIEKHAADGLGRVDYLLASGGAKIIRHSEALTVSKGVNWFKTTNHRGVHNDAEKMLKPSFGEPGHCFPLKGSCGFVEIRLRTAIIPEAITLEHVAKNVAYDRSSAPKHCRVFGWLQESQALETALPIDGEKMFLVTEFIYDLEKSSIQTFNVLDSASSNIIDTVSPHGRADSLLALTTKLPLIIRLLLMDEKREEQTAQKTDQTRPFLRDFNLQNPRILTISLKQNSVFRAHRIGEGCLKPDLHAGALRSRATNVSVFRGWRLWVRAIHAISGCFRMTLRREDSKSKSFFRKMFSAKDWIRRGEDKDSAETQSLSCSGTAMQAAEIVKTLRIFVATWNVGGNPPRSDLNLDDFLQIHDESDIYILGFQEIVPLNAGNVLVIEDSEPASKWLSLINQSLNKSCPTLHPMMKSASSPDSKTASAKGCKLRSTPSGSLFFQKYSLKAVSKQFRTESKRRLKACNCTTELERRYSKDSCFRCQQSNVSDDDLSSEDDDGQSGVVVVPEILTSSSSSRMSYGLVVSKQMVGIFLTIWVKKELVQHIGHLKTSCISRGIMGCLGNKGCISVSMSLYQTSFCFICSHLASGEKEGDELRRNLDVIETLKNTQFPRRCKVPNTRVPEKILDHDRIVWLGDLNYRIALSYAETRRLLERNDWDALLSKDQLKIEREAGRVFEGWREGKIYFAPTYKYSFNSDTYFGDTIKSKNKRRTPAWCDRILWRGNGMHQLSYARREMKHSDHRPVCARFLVQVSIVEERSKWPAANSNMKVEIEELLPASDRQWLT
ncbi:hypothetical protein Nepgr_001359 [Nepenthes gracilis]|uniref:SUN domain-containing protein n=1 Tax=Nepenthes gracilis TaxID=150966 RepID=A0AAD3P2L4_NEPGR|nr:hypothetical protein Nepgr_001359 [Nepenthes gracilis]